MPPLTKGKLNEYIAGVDVAFNLWPSWYHRINSASKVHRGESILSELENAKLILSNHLESLLLQDEHNLNSAKVTTKCQPNVMNVDFNIISKKS